MITVEKLEKRYGDFTALKGISFEVAAGQIMGFLGVNGAGKTTTLRILAGILRPSSGRATLGGFDIARDPEKAKSLIGFIPDRPHLYGKLTAREYLWFICDMFRMPQALAEQRIEEVLAEYSLSAWSDQLIESFSHGMKQRIATCGALVHDPKILIVDEPMVGLDPHGAKLLKDSLRKYARNGMAILLSTHSLNVAEEVADQLTIINQGTIIAAGTLSEVRAAVGSHASGLEQIFLELTAPSTNEPIVAP